MLTFARDEDYEHLLVLVFEMLIHLVELMHQCLELGHSVIVDQLATEGPPSILIKVDVLIV